MVTIARTTRIVKVFFAFGAVYAPATLLCIPELVCHMWIVALFVRFAGETGERH